jgi:hypothetical protein
VPLAETRLTDAPLYGGLEQRSRASRWLPHLLLLLWLTALGAATWQDAMRSDVPPIWDQHTYYEKARRIWEEIGKGHAFNPLDIDPAVRPPGTVLVSYPLGFDRDPRAFYFRSAFVPVVLFVVAIYVALTPAWGWLRRGSWVVPALAAFAASMPMFWQFEVNGAVPTGLWGMVDTFFASVGALSAAAFYRSATGRSVMWFGVGVAAAALCPLIKPTGMLVSGLLGLGWLAFVAVAAWRERREPLWLRRWSMFVLACAPFALLLPAVWLACLTSQYFSSQNIAFGRTALAQIAENLPARPLSNGLWWLVHIGLGWPMTVLLAGTFAWFVWHAVKRDFGRWLAPLLASGALIGTGMIFWYRAAQLQEVRYVIAFLLPAVIWLGPAMGEMIARPGRVARIAIVAALLLPAANILVLVASSSPSKDWQNFFGVNVNAGEFRAEVATARALARQTPAKGLPRLYALDSDVFTAPVEAAYAAGLRDRGSSGVGGISRPLSWEGPSAVRVADLWRSKFLLCSAAAPGDLADEAPARTFLEEVARIRNWLRSDPPPTGTRVRVDTPSVRLLEVENPEEFRRQVLDFVARHRWRERFEIANRPDWIASSKVPAGGGALEPSPVRVGNEFLIRRIEVASTAAGATVTAWIEPLGAISDGNWTFFVHGLDARNQRLWARAVPLFDGLAREGDEQVRVCHVALSMAEWKAAMALGMGIYSPGTGALILDSPQTFRNRHALRMSSESFKSQPAR